MATGLLRRPAYSGFYHVITRHLRDESQATVRRISTTHRARESDVAHLAITDRMTEAGMSSLLAPLRHRNQVFESHALQELLRGIDAESPSKEKSEVRISKARLPGLAFIAKRIRRGQILVPMSKFMDVAIPQILANTNATTTGNIDRLSVDAMLHTLSTTAIQADRKLSTIVQRINRERLWKPTQLPSSTDISRMPVKHLCAYALATVYDVACQLHIIPSQGSMAATIRALAACDVDLQTFARCVTLVLLQLSGVPFHQAQLQASEESMQFRNFDAANIQAVIITAAIDGFGILGKPELGETLLTWWSSARKRSAIESIPVYLPVIGKTFDASCWHDDQAIWTALLRARVKIDDIESARHWLNEYRRIVPSSQKSTTLYMDYVKACMTSEKSEINGIERTCDYVEEEKPTRLNVMLSTMGMLRSDGVPCSDALSSLYVNTLVGHGKLREAALAIHKAFGSNLVPTWSLGISKAVIRLHRMHMIRSDERQSAFAQVFREVGSPSNGVLRKHGPYHDPRQFIIYATPRIQRADMENKRRFSPALEDALQCAVVHGDLPLALYVLDHMQSGSLTLGFKTTSMVSRWLSQCKDGHTPVLHKRPAERPTARQKEGTLASHASHSRLLRAPPMLISYADTEVDGGFTHLRRQISERLVQAVHACSMYDVTLRSEACSPWLLSILAHLDEHRPVELMNEDILDVAMQQLLQNT